MYSKTHTGMLPRALAALLMAALLCTPVVSATAEGEFSAYVKTNSMRVYADPGFGFYLGALSKLTVFTVVSYESGVARIRFRGQEGYASVSDMGRVADVATLARINKDTKVYAKASSSSKATPVKRGLLVYVLKTSGGWAMIERSGEVAYIKTRYLEAAGQTAQTPAEPDGGEVVYAEFQAVVTSDTVKVYAKPSSSAKYLGAMRKGTQVTVEAYNDDWAYIELNGRHGFCLKSALQKYVPDPHAYLSDGKMSNEKVIYKFLTTEMNLSSAAACGILANIKYESGYRENASGDGGRSHGICQWFSTRWTRLETYCSNRDMDSGSLAGQLWFLKYELEKYYPMVHKYLTESVTNDAQGAYSAGWYFCYHFEGPSSRDTVSVTRAKYARDTLWARYN